VVLTFEVPRECAGQRLDRFIQRKIPRLSRTRAQRIIRACAFRSDGSRRRPSELVRAGEVVLLVRERFEEPKTPLEFGILYRDEAILGVDKPPGLPVHPSATYHKHTLSYLLRERYERDGKRGPRIAHRLDRETSGVVLCGCTAEDERTLKIAFEDHEVEKSYLAIVRGRLRDDRGSIELPMRAVKEGLHLLMEICEPGEGLEARTGFAVRERRGNHTLLELSPKTGRQHQLRVHLSAIGHPIVGDKLYGPEREAPFLEYIETGMTDALAERVGHRRHALHAHSMTFRHPRSGEPFTLNAPLPRDLVELWERL
jgi:23S rRNA pseudouridine1911/1915/1917 synthase